MSNEPISIQYAKAAHLWCDLDAAATMLEESKSAILSQRIKAQGDIPINRAETNVKSSSEWRDYIREMVDARTKANHAKVEVEYLRMRMQEWISADANNRIQAKL